MSGSIDDSQANYSQADWPQSERSARESGSESGSESDSSSAMSSANGSDRPSDAQGSTENPSSGASPADESSSHERSGHDPSDRAPKASAHPPDDAAWAEMDRVLSDDEASSSPPPQAEPAPDSTLAIAPLALSHAGKAPLSMVETAFLASTASLLWLVSYYLSIGPWMRIFFPAPIALVYLRWGHRAAWMSAIVSCLLLSVLMGPYLSLLFFIPYGLLGVQLGMLWRRRAGWPASIALSTIVSTFSFFFRIWILSAFIGEDLWVYLTGRITDLLGWISNRLVDWGILGIGMLGQPDVTLVQIATVGMVICSDIVYLFTVHLAAWLLFERLGNAIPEPPTWVKVLLEEE